MQRRDIRPIAPLFQLPIRRGLTLPFEPTLSALKMNRAAAQFKYLYQTCSSQSVQVLLNFVQLVLALDQICSIAQLYAPALCVNLKWKPKNENAPKTEQRKAPRRNLHAERPPAAGPKPSPRAVADRRRRPSPRFTSDGSRTTSRET
jgi:hypothetical protein